MVLKDEPLGLEGRVEVRGESGVMPGLQLFIHAFLIESIVLLGVRCLLNVPDGEAALHALYVGVLIHSAHTWLLHTSILELRRKGLFSPLQ